jgi:hypothetical protein
LCKRPIDAVTVISGFPCQRQLIGEHFDSTVASEPSRDGVVYTDIEVIVEMDGDIRDTVQLVKTLERPLKERK